MKETEDFYQTKAGDPSDFEGAREASRPDLPERFGRYRVEKLLGRGGFGVVYLGHDEELSRPVAIKVPRRELMTTKETVESYLSEARVLASLDHPHVVPVYDVGSTEDGLCFVVSKLIEGNNLGAKGCQYRGSPLVGELVAAVAEALHHAHRQGLVHRDVKPANILLDNNGKPYVADFGLALKEQDFGKGPEYAGTPAYMSPEQARGEGHRVDGRSDIFSLGVVLYELLTGRRPFQGKTHHELLQQIVSLEPRPPRQIDDTIPMELERICLKAMAKRASERYTTAKDMAEDLRYFLAQTPAAASVTRIPSEESTRKVIPKGLRSFDAHDADFFLELLPGPRDRDGLPDSIRVWKSRIEETDAGKTFAVGLLYGPSGCGKSSLVKAGLLPRLADHVTSIYVEATAGETETRILKGLRKYCPEAPSDVGLKETIASLRHGVAGGKKVLLILDQFEQWLHAHRGEEQSELAQALRHCDGERLQCLLMVRDDFWLAVSRFMKELEVPIVEGQNSGMVDLFDLRHARKVLAAFGRAFGALPQGPAELSKPQEQFLEEAVLGLAEEDKVISVRLALFAEMVKGKSWTPATLKEVGGMEGVGVRFLEETFCSKTAPPGHRLHQKAVLSVLKALLPEAATEIKGHRRSYAELLEASGYANRPNDFENVLRILDGELRLLTPTDVEAPFETPAEMRSGERYYQLTHDYLVPSVREWLILKQKESRRGRAELRLAIWSSVWNAKPENRNLPSWWEWAGIRLLTHRKTWSPPQQKMMRQATRYHTMRGTIFAGVCLVAAVVGLVIRGRVVEQNQDTRAAGLVLRLLDAKTQQVPGIIDQLREYRRWADPLLKQAFAGKDPTSRNKLHAALALLRHDRIYLDHVFLRLLEAAPEEIRVLHQELQPHRAEVEDRLWKIAETNKDPRFLAAACLLAWLKSEKADWPRISETVVAQTLDSIQRNPSNYSPLLETFEPVRRHLLIPLCSVFRDRGKPDAVRSIATNLLAEYAKAEVEILADLIIDADEMQFAMLFPRVEAVAREAIPKLQAVVTTSLDRRKPQNEKELLAKRQANAAVALLRLNHSEHVWPVLKHSPDPRVRSYLVHRFRPLGAPVAAILKRIDEEPDVTARRALMLALGDFEENDISTDDRKMLTSKLQDLYRTDADPGLHAAVEWVLRNWKQHAWLEKVNAEWARDKAERERRLKKANASRWYVNAEVQTMVVIPGPVEFVMGSPATEAGRRDVESQHKKRIARSFAVAATQVTKEQFLRFMPKFSHAEASQYADPTCPIGWVNWHEAAAYCNWLSKQEGIPDDQRCYELNEKGEVTKLKPNWRSLTGYRLPTEAEMEYATRAGAVTSRHHGETEELLPKYAWYIANSRMQHRPVATLKPNDLGLFDTLGNVFVWCQDVYQPYPEDLSKIHEEPEDGLVVDITRQRILRGGSCGNNAVHVRCANRNHTLPGDRGDVAGFRVARTITP